MKRLAVAAVLAAGFHGAALWVAGPRTRPVLPLARSQSITINLVSVKAPAATPAPPAPKKIPPPPEPEPKPRKIRKPAPKPVVRRRPVPEPAPPMSEPEPSTEQLPAEPETAEPVDPGPVSQQEHAAVQESVPLYDLNPPPVYPRVARRRSYQGTVLLDVRVTAEGTVAEVKLAQSSGYSVLDRSALNSVRNWRFEPARRGTRPFETWVKVPVRFELH